jgi:lactate racemase
MKIRIPYQQTNISLELPEKQVIATIRPASTPKTSEYKILRAALKNPLNSKPITEFLQEDCLIIVNDASRSTPTAKILRALHLLLARKHSNYIISTGTHRAPTRDELSRIVGAEPQSPKRKIHIHNSLNTKSLTHIGKTRRGTEVYVNKLLAKSNNLLIIGSVEPHYFAGYTGGRKSLIPGLAGYQTIEQNHRWALSPDSQPLRLEGNPVHDDLMEAVALLDAKKIFSIQVVLDSKGRICAAFTGDLEASFRRAVKAASKVYVTNIKEKADIVVTVAAPPLDANLYQAHKALEHGKLALKKGGTIILVAACPEGIGPRHFYDMLTAITSKAKIPEFLEKSKTANYTLGLHKAVKIAQLLHASEIWMKSGMPNDVMRKIHIKPIHNLQEAVEEALLNQGSNAKVIILTDGATCVPRVE